jgi:hypothetical protein
VLFLVVLAIGRIMPSAAMRDIAIRDCAALEREKSMVVLLAFCPS